MNDNPKTVNTPVSEMNVGDVFLPPVGSSRPMVFYAVHKVNKEEGYLVSSNYVFTGYVRALQMITK